MDVASVYAQMIYGGGTLFFVSRIFMIPWVLGIFLGLVYVAVHRFFIHSVLADLLSICNYSEVLWGGDVAGVGNHVP